MDGKWYMIRVLHGEIAVSIAEEEDFQPALAGYSPFTSEEIFRDNKNVEEDPAVIVGKDRENGAVTVFLKAGPA